MPRNWLAALVLAIYFTAAAERRNDSVATSARCSANFRPSITAFATDVEATRYNPNRSNILLSNLGEGRTGPNDQAGSFWSWFKFADLGRAAQFLPSLFCLASLR